METKTRISIYLTVLGLVFLGVSVFYAPKFFNSEYSYDKEKEAVVASAFDVKNPSNSTDGSVSGSPQAEISMVPHLPTPNPLKAIYMTQCVVGTKDFRASLVDLIDKTEINSVVIDIKDFTGKISFLPKDESLAHAISNTCRASDMEDFLKLLHSKNIYVIGRITVFQDPHMVSLRPDLAVQSKAYQKPWKDFKGLSFIDVGATEHADYIIKLSKEAYNVGFDEINYDYIRFPSDGDMDDVHYLHSAGKSKREALREFFEYLHAGVKDTGLVTSVDLFGMTTTNRDDLNIGQVLEYAFPYFDYVAPMVYPSHYPKNFNGWANPNHHVYELINYVMAGAVRKADAFDALKGLSADSLVAVDDMQASTTVMMVPEAITKAKTILSSPLFFPPADYTSTSRAKLRTWIQDFDYGGNYDIAEVKAQIKASRDVGVPSFMIWAPSNRYTIGALDLAESEFASTPELPVGR